MCCDARDSVSSTMMRRRGGDGSSGQHGTGSSVPLFQAVRGSWMMRTMLSFATFAFVALLFFSHGLHLSETHATQQALRIGSQGVDPVANPIAPGLSIKSDKNGGLGEWTRLTCRLCLPLKHLKAHLSWSIFT